MPVNDEASVIAAAFFHDAVYDVDADDNEARKRGVGRAGARRARVVGGPLLTRLEIVRATAGHEPTEDADEAVLLDADLAVLGSDPAAYQAYVTGVRAEHGALDDEQWRTGRGAVLRRLLDRQPMYSTEAGRSRWERRARANMAAELASLEPREQPGQ